MRTAWTIVKRVYSGFVGDNVMRLSAALAFYTALSLAPLSVIVLAILGSVYGIDAARSELLEQIRRLVGADGARVLEEVLARSDLQQGSGPAALIGAAALVLAATTVFAQLQDALNIIWHVRPAPGRRSDIVAWMRKRLLSLGVVLGIVFLMVVSLVASAAISFLMQQGDRLDLDPSALWRILNLALSLLLFTLVFAAIFKWLPDVKACWHHVWLGAGVTSVLFAAGKELIGIYLGRGGVGSAYGAAGSLFIFLLWTYYSATIVFLGAEFTRAWATRRGHPVPPADHAVSTDAPGGSIAR